MVVYIVFASYFYSVCILFLCGMFMMRFFLKSMLAFILLTMVTKSFAVCISQHHPANINLQDLGLLERMKYSSDGDLLLSVEKNLGSVYWCNGSTDRTGTVSYALSSPSGSTALGTIDGHTIYGTNIPGIAMAIGIKMVPKGTIKQENRMVSPYTYAEWPTDSSIQTNPENLSKVFWLDSSSMVNNQVINTLSYPLYGKVSFEAVIYMRLYHFGRMEIVSTPTELVGPTVYFMGKYTYGNDLSTDGKLTLWGWSASTLKLANLTISLPTCTPKDSSLKVILPTTVLSEFSGGIGSTSGLTNFNLGFTCDKNISVKGKFITSDTVLDTANTVLGKTSDTVGIQVIYKNNPLTLNVAQDFGKIGDTPSDLTISLQAQYYRTSTSTVQTGTIGATLSYVLEYQ